MDAAEEEKVASNCDEDEEAQEKRSISWCTSGFTELKDSHFNHHNGSAEERDRPQDKQQLVGKPSWPLRRPATVLDVDGILLKRECVQSPIHKS